MTTAHEVDDHTTVSTAAMIRRADIIVSLSTSEQHGGALD